MDQATVLFFQKAPAALPLYAALEERVLSAFDPVRIQVKATQISFFNRCMFAAVSCLRVRRGIARPFLTLTFGLDVPLTSPRLVSVEAAPNRWTHHVVLQRPEEIDGELIGWLTAAYRFSDGKGRKI